MTPSKIAFLAWHAWHDARVGDWPPGYPDAKHTAYDLPDIRHWLEVFVKRFFASQFKRSALPNGPKVSAGGTMSPRGDWRVARPAPADPRRHRDEHGRRELDDADHHHRVGRGAGHDVVDPRGEVALPVDVHEA